MEAPTQTALVCPSCGSGKFFKDGLRKLSNSETKQRYLCRQCGFRYSVPCYNSLNNINGNSRGSRISAKLAKNMATTTEIKNTVVVKPRTKEEQQTAKGQILQLEVHMTRQHYSPETVRLNRTALKVLFDRGANLLEPDSVKDVMAEQKHWSANRLRNVINAYDMFAKINNITWEPPRCTVQDNIYPWIPTEAEIDCLIAAAPLKLSAFLLMLKETAMRRGEGKRIEWIDLDIERCTLNLRKPEKGSNPRMWNISRQLVNKLNTLPKNNERIFGNSKMDSLKSAFLHLRKKQAEKMQNLRLLKIGFHTIRHWKATVLYHETLDLLTVRDFLGHKTARNTEKYITMAKKFFVNGDVQYTVIRTSDDNEAQRYLEQGFEWIGVKENLIFLRKRKCSSSPDFGISRGKQESMEKCAEVAHPKHLQESSPELSSESLSTTNKPTFSFLEVS